MFESRLRQTYLYINKSLKIAWVLADKHGRPLIVIVAVARTVKRNFNAQSWAYRSRLQTFTGNGDVFTRVKKKCSRGNKKQTSEELWSLYTCDTDDLYLSIQLSSSNVKRLLHKIWHHVVYSPYLQPLTVYSRSCSLCSASVCVLLPSCSPLSKFCERVPNHNCEIKWSNKVSRVQDISILLYFQLMSIWEF